jgi:hypothetical protein
VLEAFNGPHGTQAIAEMLLETGLAKVALRASRTRHTWALARVARVEHELGLIGERHSRSV